MAPRLTGRTLRRSHTFDVQLSEGAVTLRRLDLMNEWLTGKTEHALVSQVYAAERVFGHVSPTVDTLSALEALPAEERRTLLDGLRMFATIAVVSPRVTLIDDGDPDSVPVGILNFQDLMTIWNAKPPADVAVDPDQPLALPVQEDGEAARFPESVAGTESPEPIRDDTEGTRGAIASVALPSKRAPYPGLVSLTTH